ncbi:hypothetical protein OG342_14965 [Streptomyces bobili]|uniref:hypothetical protein n=1 Tax=Streptomyces bobili TaxID=67280 RepID=UPI00224D9363|nr:hypothetical protein [Streptomyces bobili]MCX5524156.1 hypothetical protein [Streptomyces bobili]
MAEYIFRRGKVNAVFGDRGVGKTWVATGAAAQFLREGQDVTWFCFDCPPGNDSAARCMAQQYERLGMLGVGDRISRFRHYPNPPADWWPLRPYETSPTGLVVFDGMREDHDHEAYIQPFHTSAPTATVLITEADERGGSSVPLKVPLLCHLNDGTDTEGEDDGGEMTRLSLDEMFSPGYNSPTDHTYRIV